MARQQVDIPCCIAQGRILAASCTQLSKCRGNSTDACVLAPYTETVIPYFRVVRGTWDTECGGEGGPDALRINVTSKVISLSPMPTV